MEENVKKDEVINNIEEISEVEESVENIEVINDDKNKKILLIVAISLFVIGIVILFCVAILGGSEDEKGNDKKPNNNEINYTNETYFMYMDIKPAFKLEIEEKYTDCTTGKCLVEIKVVDYELMEEDTDELFKNYELPKENELNLVINDILDYAEDKGIYFNNVDFYSDSDELGNYINIFRDTEFLYGYYLSDTIDSVDEFYGRQEIELPENNEDEPVEEPVVTKQFNISKPSILIKNTNKNYIYHTTKFDSVSVTVTGVYSEVNYLDSDINFFVDVKNLEVGEYEVTLNVNNKSNLDLEFDVKPNKIKVFVNDKTTTTSSSTTKGTTTTKTTSRSDVEINLNDNVKVYKITSCGGYESIKKECINANIGELKAMYPDYNKYLDDADYLTDDMKVDGYYSLVDYFPGCILDISDSTKSKLTNIKGMYPTYSGSHVMKPNWIGFVDYQKYSKFTWDITDYSKYDLYYDAPCGGGGGGEPTYYTLDEEMCEEYNLPCARW